MAFRIAQLKASGERIQTALISQGAATISASPDADLKVDFKADAFLKIKEENKLCKLEVKGLTVNYRNHTVSDGKFCLGTGCEFTCGDDSFYATIVNDGSPTEFKKGYLANAAIFLTWSLLVIQIVVPAWLPFKITSHTAKGRSVLAENCSSGLDQLRNSLRDSGKDISNISPIHNDIMANLKEEIEQITWTYRNAGEFMTAEQLSQLLDHIEQYKFVLKELKKSQVITVQPIDSGKVIEGLPL